MKELNLKMDIFNLNLSSIKKPPPYREELFNSQKTHLFNKHRKSLEHEISLELKKTNDLFNQSLTRLSIKDQTKQYTNITNSKDFFKHSKIPKPCSKYSITLNKYSDLPTRIPKYK